MGIKTGDSIGAERRISVLERCKYGRQRAHPEVTEIRSAISAHSKAGDNVVDCVTESRSRPCEAGYTVVVLYCGVRCNESRSRLGGHTVVILSDV